MKTKLSAAVLFTGGKDSCLALFKAEKRYDVRFLLTVMPKNPDSFMFHKPNLDLLERQAEMLRLPIIVRESKGEKEKELKDLEDLLKLVKGEVEVIVVGGIKSNYQAQRIKRLCKKLALGFYAPLWNYSSEKIWIELLKRKFKVILTKVSCEGLPKEFIGKIIGKKELEKLKKLSEKYKFRLDFEGGGAETSVLYMPGMQKEIKLRYKVRSEGAHRHLIKIIQITS
jgi:asparagine synthase (glutamine-hydrolysing)